MVIANLIVGGSCLFAALLIFGLSVPLLRGSIGPNNYYGMRIAKSFESESNWYAINRYGAKHMMIWSVPMGLFGCLCPFLPSMETHIWLAVLAGLAPIVFLVPPIVATFRFARTC